MTLVTFDIAENSDLILKFLEFVQQYSQSPITLYQIEMVPVLDQNTC